MATISPAAFSSRPSTVNLDSENLGWKRHGQIVLHHREEAHDCFLLVVAVDRGLLNQRPKA